MVGATCVHIFIPFDDVPDGPKIDDPVDDTIAKSTLLVVISEVMTSPVVTDVVISAVVETVRAPV
ncbi:MAG: hypothetical protein ACYCPT_10575, partial [Acidimicrobiales bacterium]